MNKWQTEGNCGQWFLAMQGSFSLSVIVKPWGSAHSNSVSIKNPKVFRHSTQRTPEIFHRKRFLTKNNVPCFRFVIPCSSPGKKRSPKPISTSYWFNLKRISYINIFDFDIFEWMNEWMNVSYIISWWEMMRWNSIPQLSLLYQHAWVEYTNLNSTNCLLFSFCLEFGWWCFISRILLCC